MIEKNTTKGVQNLKGGHIAVLTPITKSQRQYLEGETLVSWQDWPAE